LPEDSGPQLMRILLVANTLPPRDISGVGEQVLQLASGLGDRGHRVEVLGRGADGARGPKVLFPLTVVMPLFRHLRYLRPHVVQVHESDGALVAFLVRIVAALFRPQPLLVALLQVSYVEERRAVRALRSGSEVLGRPGGVEHRFRWIKAPLQIALGCLTAWLADVVLAPSATTAAEIERDYQVRGIQVLPNVMAEKTSEAPSHDGWVPEAPGGSFFLFVGRLRIRKGVEVLLHALAAMRKQPQAIAAESRYLPTLLIAGDGEHRGTLERLTASLELGGSVTFLGRQDGDAVRGLLARSSALVVPSTYEGMPLVILEAMEARVPVVASAVSGIPEVVVDGETGWLVPPEDVGSLLGALREVVDGPDEARRRGFAGAARLESSFRPEHAAEIWENSVALSLDD